MPRKWNQATYAECWQFNVCSTYTQDGLVNFNTVISTLNALQNQQDLLVATQGAVANNLVQVFKSLGGVWGIRQGRTLLELLSDQDRFDMLQRTRYWEKILERIISENFTNVRS